MQQFTLVRLVLRQRRFRKMLLFLILIYVVLGLLIVPVEKSDPSSRIQTYFDGIWWATSTVTTVGYGDYVPITTVGRIIGIILQITGALMFGAIVAMISMAVDKTQAEFHWKRTRERFDKMEELLHRIEKNTSFMIKSRQEK